MLANLFIINQAKYTITDFPLNEILVNQLQNLPSAALLQLRDLRPLNSDILPSVRHRYNKIIYNHFEKSALVANCG